MAKKRDKSLGDEFTQLGDSEPVSPPESERSLGDQSTYGDAGSSISDLSDLSGGIDDEMPIVELAERYTIQGPIGKGGMGEVLRAIDTRLDRPVAIKRVLGKMAHSQKALARFRTEAKSIAALNHFNVVQIYDYGRDKDGPFIIMELVEGKSLHEKLKDGPLELEAAIDMTCQLCDALSVAHEQGVIHRDIKPANILLTARSEPKLTDFGLAKQETADHGKTMAGAVLGTIDFMPPEQRRDATAADARSDLWSLAATCYMMITGNSPKVIRLDQLPNNLAPVIGKMLEEDPGKRYATAAEFKTELRKGMATSAVTVSADLTAGVCPSCNTANDASRKFCRGCGDSLELTCLSCGKEMPVWENFCGACGSSQQEKRDEIREKLSAVIETSLSLAREYQYEEALEQLNSVPEDKHDFTQDIREWANKQIELVTAQRDEQYQLRDEIVQLAKQHQKAHDYAGVIKELERIPAPLRTERQIASQLSNAIAVSDELSSLEQQISSDIENKQIDGQLEKTTRFLELSPLHSEIQKVHDQLLERQEKELLRRKQEIASQITSLLEQAEQQYGEFQDEDVLATLANCPQGVAKSARVDELHKMATDRLARIEELKADIDAAIDLSEKLTLVKTYLLLRPGDVYVQQEKQLLRKQLQQITSLLEQAEQQYGEFQDEDVLATLANCPQGVAKSARVDELHKMATDRLARIEELKADIDAAIDLSEKLTLVKTYLLLRPGDVYVQQEKQLLRKQLQQITSLLEQAEQQYGEFQDQAVLATLANWPQGLERTARFMELQRRATNRLRRIEELKAAAAAERDPDIALELVTEYRTLRPHDEQGRQLEAELKQITGMAKEKNAKDAKELNFVIISVGMAVAFFAFFLIAVGIISACNL